MFSRVFLSLFILACNNRVPADPIPEAGTDEEQSSAGDEGSHTTDSEDEDTDSDGGNANDESHDSDADDVEPQDQDEDGFMDDVDCNDHDPRIHPGAQEFCDGIDTDCDGVVDPNSSIDAFDWYRDGDGDGFGDIDDEFRSCERPGTDWVENSDDCDDDEPLVHPEAEEVCDGIDNDCDGVIDPPRSIDAVEWFIDADEDGFGQPDTGVQACWRPEGSWSHNGSDCDDARDTIYPGADEFCDGVDADCDGEETEGIATWNSGWSERVDVTAELESGMFHRLEYGELSICDGVWHTRFEFETSGIVPTLATKVAIKGIGNVIIDGSDEGRLISIGDGVPDLELSNLTLRGGQADRGAALYGEELDLILNDVRFSDNHSSGPGGAVFIGDGHIVMDAVEFSRNTSSGYGAHGGAIRLQQGDIEGTDVQFEHNEAEGMASGGGICLMEGTVTLENAEFSQNHADYKGGAIKIGSGDVNLIDSTMSRNSALSGGAVFVGGSADLIRTQFVENDADFGGGLYLANRDGWQYLSCDALDDVDAGFKENAATEKGGAVYLADGFGTVWESMGCDWGAGSTDNRPKDIDSPLYAYDAEDGAEFSCTHYWCDGSVSAELTEE